MAIKIYQYNTSNVEQASVAAHINNILLQHSNSNYPIVLFNDGYNTNSLQTLLQQQNIPYCKNNNSNVLQHKFFKKLFAILQYLQTELLKPNSGNHFLVEILHINFLEIAPVEIATLCVETSKTAYHKPPGTLKNTITHKVLAEPKNLFDEGCSQALKNLYLLLNDFLANAAILPLPLLIKYIVESNIVANYIANNTHKNEIIQVINNITNEAKNFADIHLFVAHINSLIKANTALLFKVADANNYVQLCTTTNINEVANKHIFLIGTNTISEQQQISIAAIINTAFAQNSNWNISFTADAENDHTTTTTFLIKTILATNNIKVETIHTLTQAQIQQPSIPIINNADVQQVVAKFALSASALNSFLNCPLQFYFYNIIKIPQPKNEAFEFGNAIHYALEMLFKNMVATKVFETQRQLQQHFTQYMQLHIASFSIDNYNKKLQYGQAILAAHYNKYIHTWPKIVTIEKMITGVTIKNVPIKGKIDKLEFDGNDVTVVDYKSGNVTYALQQLQPPNEQLPIGGNYWRQAVFYKILVDNYTQKNWQVTNAEFDFIEEDETGNLIKQVVPITQADVATVTQQIQHTWQQIQAHNFFKGCGKYNCYCCNLVNYMA